MNPGFLIVFWLSAISAISAITTDRFDALWAHHEWDQWAPENDGGDRFLVWQIWERIGNQWGGSWVLFWGRKGSIQTLVSNRFDIDTETVENISIALVLGMDRHGITKEMKTIRQQETLEVKEQDSRALQTRKSQAHHFSCWASTLIQWRETRAT